MIEIRYDILDPAQFHQGDIVEVETTLTLVPIKNDGFKLLAVLRSITLLDATHSQVNTTRLCHTTTDRKTKASDSGRIQTSKYRARNPKKASPQKDHRIQAGRNKDYKNKITTHVTRLRRR
jgi:hypothetical protein